MPVKAVTAPDGTPVTTPNQKKVVVEGTVPDHARLTIHYLGFAEKSVAAEGGNNISIKLEKDTHMLSDVVVVGYGTQKKVNISGSVDQLTAKDLEKRPITDVSRGLQGMIPNLNIDFASGEPGKAASLNIRGEASINGGSPLILTTDHGREEHGFGHGGQSAGERGIWMVSNRRDMNAEWGSGSLSQVDVNPSICRFMGFDVPRDVEWEQDGIPFFGNADIYGLTTTGFDNKVMLKWGTFGKAGVPADVYIATSNNRRNGGKDEWKHVARVKASDRKCEVDLGKYAASDFYKFVVVPPNNHVTRWFQVKR